MIGRDTPPDVGKDTQFKPGESGNPDGKPKGSKHISTHIQEMLDDENFELKLKDGTVMKGRPMQAILKAAIVKAAKGDVRAFTALAKYGYGEKQIHSFENGLFNDNQLKVTIVENKELKKLDDEQQE